MFRSLLHLFGALAMACVPPAPQTTPGVRGATGATGPTGAPGALGPRGDNGAMGTTTLYGSGADGTLRIISDADWSASPPDSTLQFQDLVIEAGVTLVLPSGLIVRCTGSFSNRGTVIVKPTPGAGGRGGAAVSGIGAQSATMGASSRVLGVTADGAPGAAGVSRLEVQSILLARTGGGGGSPSPSPLASRGAGGGGAFVVVARGDIINDGVIDASADVARDMYGAFPGAGGGGGGVVVLASERSVANTGMIVVRGSDGNAGGAVNWPQLNGNATGGGGGGGGGLVRIIAPSVRPENGGIADVSGGLGGQTPDLDMRDAFTVVGGGGGGGSGGSGGAGASIEFKGPGVPGDWGLVAGADAKPGSAGLLVVERVEPVP